MVCRLVGMALMALLLQTLLKNVEHVSFALHYWRSQMVSDYPLVFSYSSFMKQDILEVETG